jgi:cytochrome oxidase Cu insertion factor (SCO1/SenC/PrrC family)
VRELVIKGFMLTVIDQENGEFPIVHATKLVLVDRNGVMRAFYDGENKASDARIIRDVERLRRQ